MRMKVNVWTPKGHYAERGIECSNMKQGIAKILELLDAMPDSIGDEVFVDWSRVTVDFERERQS